MLEVIDVSFKYNGPWVLKDVGFKVNSGDFVGILGPNGSGKSTLLRVIDGILLPQKGQVLWNGTPIQSMKRKDVAKIIALVPQGYAGVFPFTVQEIILMGRSPHLGLLAFEGEKDLEIVWKVMEQTETQHLAHRSLENISGGERQRVLVARALAQEPQLLLLDEPTAYLDVRHQADILKLIRTINRVNGLTVVLVTHDINLASLYCDRVILLKEGSILAEGTPEEVLSEEQIKITFDTTVIASTHTPTGRPLIIPWIEV
ncbi:MAG: ABC transporter ATP-binding protein [Syntrophales bacterium]|nr:ABC transporter ATP-binding protein [Syntrophales bacterium]